MTPWPASTNGFMCDSKCAASVEESALLDDLTSGVCVGVRGRLQTSCPSP